MSGRTPYCSLISPIAMRTDAVPMSITAAVRTGIADRTAASAPSMASVFAGKCAVRWHRSVSISTITNKIREDAPPRSKRICHSAAYFVRRLLRRYALSILPRLPPLATARSIRTGPRPPPPWSRRHRRVARLYGRGLFIRRHDMLVHRLLDFQQVELRQRFHQAAAQHDHVRRADTDARRPPPAR